MIIRQAAPEDLSKLAKIYLAAFQSIAPEEQWTETSAEQLMRFFLNTQPDLFFIAEQNAEIVGGITGLVKPWWDGPRLVLTEIFINPASQNARIGSKLYAYYLDRAVALHQVSEMEAITFKNQDFPASWYHKLGFVDQDEWKVIVAPVATIQSKLKIPKL